MGDIIFDAETVGVDHNHPDFEILFNGWMLEDGTVIQDCTTIPTSGRVVAHNASFDLKCLLSQGISIEPFDVYDTQCAMHILRPDLQTFKLESFANVLYSHKNYKGLVNFRDGSHVEDIGVLKMYNFHDLKVTKLLLELTEPKLKAQGQYPLALMMFEFIKELSYVEMEGIGTNLEEINRQGAIYTAKKAKVLEELRNYASIDWNSPLQIRDLFIKKGFRLPRTRKDNPSVNESALIEITNTDQGEAGKLASKLLEYRGIHKQLSTYIEGFKALLYNGVYYPNYSLLSATGRLKERFIQVMPRIDVSDFKRCIVSKFKGGSLLEADWGQLELRLNAEISGDKALIKDLNNGIDLHAETLARFPFLPNRTRAKNVNFSVFFGGKGYTLVHEYGLTDKQAKEIREDLLEKRYPGMNDYFTACEFNLLTRGYVESFYGRRGYTNKFTEAYNRSIQGAGSDWNKLMLISLNRALRTYESHVVCDVHDSLIIDVHPKEKKEVLPIVRRCYEEFPDTFAQYFPQKLKMKYVAEYKMGKNLYDMKGLP